MKSLSRGGAYYRVCDPSWENPLETSFSKHHGGRWNPPNVFGALYLNATIEVAAANARRNYEDEIATLYDLQPRERPDLFVVDIRRSLFLDVVTGEGIKALRLPASFPIGATHSRCWSIAGRAYSAPKIHGVASRSNAEATAASFVGEELAVFDRSIAIATRKRRLPFARWYPTELRGLSPRA